MPSPYSTGVDAHTHLDHPRFDADRAEVVARAHAAGVSGFVIAGADPAHWSRVLSVASQTGAHAMLGVHPWWADVDASTLEGWVGSMPLASGVGELGLDRVRATTDRAWERQLRAFRACLSLARDRDVPIAVHAVRALPEVLGVLAKDGIPRAGGLLHDWRGGPDLTSRALALGMHISVGPHLARRPSAKLVRAVAACPADRLLLESDCPDRPLRGDRGEPAHLIELAQAVAELRGEDPRHTLGTGGDNARRLLGISPPPPASPSIAG